MSKDSVTICDTTRISHGFWPCFPPPMPKRKAPADAVSNDDSTQRRRTRSSGPLIDTQPLFSQSKTRTPSKRSIVVESAPDAHETSSLKENEAEDSDDADELNLSFPETRRGRTARRAVMDS